MRITGGCARGRRVYAPKSDTIRVTSDKVRESLFAILPPMEGTLFLDIYAGTGSVGIEALSRGSAGAVFIEREPLHAEMLRKNLKLCGFEEMCEVVVTSAQRGIRLLSERKQRFDVVFADPPYGRGLVGELLALPPGVEGLVAERGVLVVEHSFREEVTASDVFVPADRRRYGDTVLSFLKSRR
ncbi:MAG: 16S rRNA (guanine(966)-N(2))-methyltransferase RsmD [Deltaproteobacteria bacterium]|nr:16S rRNA (guanine(966)-N(2))-methyltransferase RsmD [Deltaproteobacteria bacterium]